MMITKRKSDKLLMKCLRIFRQMNITIPDNKKNTVCNYIKENFNLSNILEKNELMSEFIALYKNELNIYNLNKNSKSSKNAETNYRNKAISFYKSTEWRRLRYKVLKKQQGKCQLCGRSAKDGVILHVDHIVPLSKDWSKRLDEENLQVLCEDCNLGKINSDSIDWRIDKR